MATAPQSAFGAALGSPAQAAAVLRARASAAGLELKPASDADLAAAVLGAHCWALAAARTTLGGAMTPDQAADLAIALARAAGHGRDWGVDDELAAQGAVDAVPDAVLAAVGEVVGWVLGVAGPEAVRRASRDMALAGDSRLASLGALVWGLDEVVPSR